MEQYEKAEGEKFYTTTGEYNTNFFGGKHSHTHIYEKDQLFGIPSNLPRSGVKEFIGRNQKLQDLHEQLQNSQRIAITAIAGMGGIGKTELALQYAILQLKEDQYPGGFCWLRARDQEIATQIVTFAQTKLGLTPPDSLNEKSQVDYCWGHWREGDVLVVIDDVTEFDAVESYLPPSDPKFKVLITTRQNLGSSVQSMSIEELDDESGLELLKTLVGQERVDAQIEAAKTLCNWVGNLPLGLELLGRFLARKPDWSFQKLIERLESKRLETKALNARESGMTAQLGIAAALELSWVELSTAEKELACLLGMFAVAPIPWTLIEKCVKVRKTGLLHRVFTSIQFWKLKSHVELNTSSLEEYRDQGLIARNFLKREGQGTYQLHQIVQEFFRIKLAECSEEKQDLKVAYCKAMVNVTKRINDSSTIDVVTEMSVSIPHLEELIKQWSDHLSEDDLTCLYGGISQFYERQGNYGLALPWREKCLEQMRQIFGHEHLDVATNLNKLALLYFKQGQYEEAETLYNHALEMRQKHLGNEHTDVATSLNNLADLYFKQGRYEEAETLSIQALEMRQKLLGHEHPDVATSLSDLAELYRNQGRYEEAETLYNQVLQMDQKLLGNENSDVAISLNNLALLYTDQGRYKEAETLYKQALEIIQNQLGTEHPDVALSLQNLALLYSKQGRYEEAETLFIQTIEIFQQLLGNEHPSIATNYTNLANLYLKQGRYSEAEIFYIQALEMHQQLLGNEHPDVALSLNNLAGVYVKQERYEDVEPLFVQAIEMFQQLLGNEHSLVADSLSNLAYLYNKQERYQEAETLSIQALEMRQKLLGNEHPDVALSLNNLADIYRNQERYEEAEPLYIQALEMRQNLLGAEHPDTVKVQSNFDDCRRRIKESNT